MEEKIIITAGKKYIDIDAYAGIFAYKELLQSLGYNTYAITSAIINESVPKVIIDLGFEFDDITIDKNSKFIILDVSNPDFFDKFVNIDNILEIIDHHVGYEEYWKNFNIKSQIEFIGSICTIIFEKYVKNKKTNLLTPSICKLLIAGILDNTLNLKSKNTTKRDIEAYNSLLKIGNIDKNWGIEYFNSCYLNLENNLENSIINDIKIEKTSSILPETFGQLIVLNNNVIFNNMDTILSIFNKYNEWIFNVICLSEGKSYLFYSDSNVENNLIKLFGNNILNNCIIIDNCMLRKEIIKKAKDFDKNNKQN